MPEMPDVAPSEIAASQWANDIRDRTLQRYATTADRDAENPTPQDGDLAYIAAGSVNKLMAFHEGAWQDVVTAGDGAVIEGSIVARRTSTLAVSIYSDDEARLDFRQKDGGTLNRWVLYRKQSSGTLKLLGETVGDIIEWTAATGLTQFLLNVYVGKILNTTGTSFGQFWHRNIWINRSPTTPTGVITGDLWFDSSSNTVSAWSGSAWTTIIDGNA